MTPAVVGMRWFAHKDIMPVFVFVPAPRNEQFEQRSELSNGGVVRIDRLRSPRLDDAALGGSQDHVRDRLPIQRRRKSGSSSIQPYPYLPDPRDEVPLDESADAGD